MGNESAKPEVLQIPVVATKIEGNSGGLFSESSLWFAFAIIVFLLFLKRLYRIADCFIHRLESGAAIEAGPLKLSEIRVSQDPTVHGSRIQSFIDTSLNEKRNGIYKSHKNVFLAHKLFPSSEPNQLYDVLIYLVPHKTDLNSILKVEYFFGEYWNSQVFESSDKEKRFAILTSAYGSGFLCLAKIFPVSGEPFYTSRYIDFETGVIGKSNS